MIHLVDMAMARGRHMWNAPGGDGEGREGRGGIASDRIRGSSPGSCRCGDRSMRRDRYQSSSPFLLHTGPSDDGTCMQASNRRGYRIQTRRTWPSLVATSVLSSLQARTTNTFFAFFRLHFLGRTRSDQEPITSGEETAPKRVGHGGEEKGT